MELSKTIWSEKNAIFDAATWLDKAPSHHM
jgi:hypothetical protein